MMGKELQRHRQSPAAIGYKLKFFMMPPFPLLLDQSPPSGCGATPFRSVRIIPPSAAQ
jgi:hypothetical protein